MATASEYWSLLSNASRALAGDWLAGGAALAKLYDIARELTGSPARPGVAGGADDVAAAYRQGVVHLGIASRAAEAGDREAARVAAGGAQQAFVAALVAAELSDPTREAEIMVHIGACNAAVGRDNEARHWMELAYRKALQLVASRPALPAVERKRLQRFLPPLGDALLHASPPSQIGLLGSGELLERWLTSGPTVSEALRPRFEDVLARWARGLATKPPSNLEEWVKPGPASTVASGSAEAPGADDALRRPAVDRGSQPPPASREPTLTEGRSTMPAGEAIRHVLHKLASEASPPQAVPFNMLVEERVRAEARQALAGWTEGRRKLEATIAKRDRMLASGRTPPTYSSAPELLREVLASRYPEPELSRRTQRDQQQGQ